MTRPMPRGIRNHNPGNLRRTADPWQGLSPVQSDAAFFTFTSAVWGIRALARTLIAYQDRHGLDTIRGIVNRWAPPVENDTPAYVAAVAARTGFAPDAPLDLHDARCLTPLVEAIIHHENGRMPYAPAVIAKGLTLAGVEPDWKPLAASRTVAGGGAAVATLVGAGTLESVLGQARETLAGLAPSLEAARWALLAVTLLSVGWMLYARFDDRRQGLR